MDKPCLFAPRRTYRVPGSIMRDSPLPGKNYHQHGIGAASTFVMRKTAHGDSAPSFLDAGEGPPGGVIVYYYLPESAEVEIAFLDHAGEVIRTLLQRYRR